MLILFHKSFFFMLFVLKSIFYSRVIELTGPRPVTVTAIDDQYLVMQVCLSSVYSYWLFFTKLVTMNIEPECCCVDFYMTITKILINSNRFISLMELIIRLTLRVSLSLYFFIMTKLRRHIGLILQVFPILCVFDAHTGCDSIGIT